MSTLSQEKYKPQASATIAASEAKARLLELISSVDESGSELVITKRGRPVAKLIPFREGTRSESAYGCMAGTFEITGDIVSPEPDVWDAMR